MCIVALFNHHSIWSGQNILKTSCWKTMGHIDCEMRALRAQQRGCHRGARAYMLLGLPDFPCFKCGLATTSASSFRAQKKILLRDCKRLSSDILMLTAAASIATVPSPCTFNAPPQARKPDLLEQGLLDTISNQKETFKVGGKAIPVSQMLQVTVSTQRICSRCLCPS